MPFPSISNIGQRGLRLITAATLGATGALAAGTSDIAGTAADENAPHSILRFVTALLATCLAGTAAVVAFATANAARQRRQRDTSYRNMFLQMGVPAEVVSSLPDLADAEEVILTYTTTMQIDPDCPVHGHLVRNQAPAPAASAATGNPPSTSDASEENSNDDADASDNSLSF